MFPRPARPGPFFREKNNAAYFTKRCLLSGPGRRKAAAPAVAQMLRRLRKSPFSFFCAAFHHAAIISNMALFASRLHAVARNFFPGVPGSDS